MSMRFGSTRGGRSWLQAWTAWCSTRRSGSISVLAGLDMCFVSLGCGDERAGLRFGGRQSRSPVNVRHAPTFDPQKEVAVFQRTRPMRDDEGRASENEPRHRLDNGRFGL